MHAIARRRVGKAAPAHDLVESPRTSAAKLRRQLSIWKPAVLLRKLSSWTTALLLSNSSSTIVQSLMKQVWRFYQGHGDSNQSLDELEMQSLVGNSSSQPSGTGRGPTYSNGRVNRATTPEKGDSSKSYRAARKGVMHARAATKVSRAWLMPFLQESSRTAACSGCPARSTVQVYFLRRSCKQHHPFCSLCAISSSPAHAALPFTSSCILHMCNRPLVHQPCKLALQLVLLLLPLPYLLPLSLLLLLLLLQFQQLHLVNKSREELEEDAELPHWVVHPHDVRCAVCSAAVVHSSSSSSS
jgi:hypothetical protein